MEHRWIIDSSVVAKWFLKDENCTTEALGVLAGILSGRVVATAPALLWLETGNVLWKAVARKRLEPGAAREALRLMASFPIVLVAPGPEDLQVALRAALEMKLTFYDATYAVLARATNSRLVTDDGELLVAASSHGVQSCTIAEAAASLQSHGES